jgi:hypothetical protein
MRPLNALGLGFLFCLAQVVMLLALAPRQPGLGSRYLELNNWDSVHYQHIAEDGYKIPEGEIHSADIHEGRANAVFFPGYPLVARGVSRVLGIPVPYALLLSAQLAAWIFWSYLFLLLGSYGASRKRVLIFAVMILFHPAAFFLVTGYTESLFLAGLLGFLFWSDRWSERGGIVPWILAALHGFVMSLTRIVSFAAALYPVMRRRRFVALILGGSSVLGAIAFFTYCQLKFGRWNVYFELEEIGWHNQRQYLAIINPVSYIPRFFFEHTVDSFNRLAVLITGLMFVWSYRIEKSRRDPHNLALYFAAFFLFYLPLTGKAAANMDSMARYTLPVFIVILLAWARSLRAWPKRRWPYIAASVFGFLVQIWFAYRFLRGHWVA